MRGIDNNHLEPAGAKSYNTGYPSDTGPIDILAISKDGKELLIVELKKGRASDVLVGQIQRYMGYVLDELAEENQTVKGVIIALRSTTTTLTINRSETIHHHPHGKSQEKGAWRMVSLSAC